VTPTTSVPAGFDESALVAQAKAGDQNAFAELVNRYERKIYRLAKNITRNDEDAEDVLQDAFLKAYTHLDNFKGDSKFYTWIVRIAVNEALMRLRKRKTDRTVPLDEPVELGVPLERPVQVPQVAVDARHDRIVGQTGADRPGHIHWLSSRRNALYTAVRKGNLYVVHG